MPKGKSTDKFHCPCCQPILKEFSTKYGMLVHVKTIHPDRYQEVQELFGERQENRFPCSFCGQMLVGNARRHERSCKENPDRAQNPNYTLLLEDFLERVGRWACNVGRDSKKINEKTWITYKGFIRRIICESEQRNPGHLINFDSLEFSQLLSIDRYLERQPNLSVPQEAQSINAYIKLVSFIRAELDLKFDILGHNVPHLVEKKQYLTNCYSKASSRLKEAQKKIPMDKEQRNWEKRTTGVARGTYTELDFQNCEKIFSRYLSSPRRLQVLQHFEDSGFIVNPEIGIHTEQDFRLFLAADLFFHGVGARPGAVVNLTYDELRQKHDHGDLFELRSFTFKTSRTFGHTPFIYPRREFEILCAYAKAFPITRTGGPRNTGGFVFADGEGRRISNYYHLMRQIQMCVPEVELPSSHNLCAQDYRHYIATLTLRHDNERLIRAAARAATHSVQMHQRYQHSEVAAADYHEIIQLVNKPEIKKKRKRIIVSSSSSSSSSEEQQQQQPPNPQQQPQEQPPNPQQQHQQQPPDPHQQLAAQLVAHMRRTGHLREPAGNAAAVSAVVESAAGSSSSSSSSEEPMPPPDFEDDFEPPQLEVRSKPFKIGNPNPNVCTVTVPGGLFLGDYYDCVACDLEEVCKLCIEKCHAECPIKSHQGFKLYRCQCGGQGVPSCNNLLAYINQSLK